MGGGGGNQRYSRQRRFINAKEFWFFFFQYTVLSLSHNDLEVFISTIVISVLQLLSLTIIRINLPQYTEKMIVMNYIKTRKMQFVLKFDSLKSDLKVLKKIFFLLG